MKTKKIFPVKIKIILAILALLVTINGCEDFLDKSLQGKLTQATFPTTPQDALRATNAIYNEMRNPNFNTGLFPILDIMSDDAYKGSNPTDQSATIGPYDRFEEVPTESSLDRWWNTLYEGIKRANVVIEKVPLIDMDVATRDRYVGEASFLRALFYFDLVRAWGGVPIVTGTDPSLNQERASKEAVYDLIEQDLLTAIESLPEKSDYPDADAGRATRGAAKSLLAKVYLYQGDFVNAEKYALEVINSTQYDLEPNFADANGVNGEFGVESVFEIGALGFDGVSSGGNQYGNTQGVRGIPNKGWGFNRPSLDLMDAFETDDPRRDATIIFLGETLDGIEIKGDGSTPDETKDGNGNTIEIETYNQKVWTPGNDVPSQWAHNRRILRYADVLLMAAEASNENDKPGQALLYLNKVRERARGDNPGILPDITETDKDALRDIILHERRVELALEGQRFWDLVRIGKAAEVLGPLGFVTGKDELLPVPQNEIDLTQKKITQNPGWDI